MKSPLREVGGSISRRVESRIAAFSQWGKYGGFHLETTLSKHGYAVNNNSRLAKAKKITTCLEYFASTLCDKELLEIGCGSGIISQELSREVKLVVAVDIADETLKSTMENRLLAGLPFEFVLGNGIKLPFRSNSFDIVVCNQVIEHVMYQQELLDEIYRVLKLNGFLYIATPNKLWPVEPHTKLPLLSYLPKPVANRYVRRFRGLDEYDVALLVYWSLKRALLNSFDSVVDLTPLIVKNPKQFCVNGEIPKPFGSVLKKVPLQILRKFLPFSPGWIIIGEKSCTPC